MTAMSILISNNISFRTEKSTRDETGNYMMMKRFIHQENIIILNVHALKNRTSKYMNEKLMRMKGETGKPSP